MSRIPPTPKAVSVPKHRIQQHGFGGDLQVGRGVDPLGNEVFLIRVANERSEIQFVITKAERDNLVRALTDEPDEQEAAAQSRARIWTPQGS